MIFPDSPRVVYEVDTIEEVICQLQFPQILVIGSESPTTFQEAIREHYPLYERQEGITAPPQVAELLSQLQVPAPQTVRHHFSTDDGNRSVTLTAQFLAVSERSYTEWGNLRDEIERAQNALQEIYRPAFYTRTGLRYQNVIDREALSLQETAWGDLLNPAVAGYLGAEEDRIEGAIRELITNAGFTDPDEEETYIRLNHGLATPEAEPNKLVYSIDADCHTQRRLEGGSVLGVLDGFNNEAGNLFRWSISPLLRDALGVRDSVEDPGANR